ncbi:MAG TPA: HAMP domain-containing protein, partial [Acidimicrobiales bacterium]|nr:HAMP domain-containing protein [Acidimicrobiales bacterium]
MATTVLDDITASDVGQVQITGIDDGSSSPSKHRPGHNDGRGDRGWHPKVRTILVLVVLLPVIATAILTGTSASSHWSDRRGAQIASVNATQLQNLAFARAKINDIRVPVMAVSFASSIGVSESVLSAVLHFDFASALKTDGEAMSKDPVFSSTPTMRADSAELHSMVASVEAGTIAFNTVKVFMAKFATDLDNLWYSAFNKLQADVEAWKPPGLFEVRLNALRQTYVAFLNGGYEIEGAIYVLEDVQGGSAKLELIQSAGVFSSATAQFQGHLGPQGQAAWTALQNSQSSRSFDQTILEGMGTAINGGQGAFVTDIPAAGAAMRNGLKYLDGLNAMVRGASGDLYTMAVNQSNSASRQFAEEIIFLFLLILVSIGGVIVAGRTLTRPLKRLSGAATRVHGGEFDLEKIPEEGPQEVVTTVTAFNEMTSTLKA